MWFCVLICCIIPMGDVFTIHYKSVGADLKNVILALNNYLMPPYTFPELHTGNGKTLNSATIIVTKSDRISLETSWLLCNFFKYVNQVSRRNSQLFPFFKFLTWYEVWYLFYRYLRTSLWQNKLIFDSWVILKMIPNL